MKSEPGEDEALKDELVTVEYASLLYDFYGALLSDAQREVMALYHEDNLSLSEIAEELGQSRQAVHYTLKKAEKALSDFDDKLGLIEAYKDRQKKAARLTEIIKGSNLATKDKDEASLILEMLAE